MYDHMYIIDSVLYIVFYLSHIIDITIQYLSCFTLCYTSILFLVIYLNTWNYMLDVIKYILYILYYMFCNISIYKLCYILDIMHYFLVLRFIMRS